MTRGLRRVGGARTAGAEGAREPMEALAAIEKLAEPSLVILKDFHPYLNDPAVIRGLRELAQSLKTTYTTVILLSPVLQIPIELEKELTVLDVPLPTHDELFALLKEIAEVVVRGKRASVSLKREDAEAIAKAAQGLTLSEAENAFAKAIAADSRLCKEDIGLILDEKRQVIRKSGLLEYYPTEEQFGNVGGLENLKTWLARRGNAFSDPARRFGLPEPKGLLLLGVQGCGKSLTAKAIASSWKMPLLRLDMGRIFSGLVGSSEENLRRAIRVAESVAPAVLWTDEIEKGLSGMGSSGFSDGGVTARVFGAMLTWLQEKTAPVFVVATANRIDLLPPELLRKGRFDEIFFIDLPAAAERAGDLPDPRGPARAKARGLRPGGAGRGGRGVQRRRDRAGGGGGHVRRLRRGQGARAPPPPPRRHRDLPARHHHAGGDPEAPGVGEDPDPPRLHRAGGGSSPPHRLPLRLSRVLRASRSLPEARAATPARRQRARRAPGRGTLRGNRRRDGQPGPPPGNGVPSTSTDRFRPPPERPLETAGHPEDAQPFTRCASCQMDNTVYAAACQNCGAALDTPAQRDFNERLWASRRAEAEAERRAAAELEKERQRDAAAQARARRELAEEMARQEKDRIDDQYGAGRPRAAVVGHRRDAAAPPRARRRLAHRDRGGRHRDPAPAPALRARPDPARRHGDPGPPRRALLARAAPHPEVVMSQNVGIVVAVQGLAVLLQVVAELGAQYRAEKKMRTADGATHDVDYVVKDGEAEVGLRVDKKTDQVTIIPKDCDAGPGKALAGRIAQRWAYSKAVGELKRKGYTVAKEEKQADGTVRVVMQRWR